MSHGHTEVTGGQAPCHIWTTLNIVMAAGLELTERGMRPTVAVTGYKKATVYHM